MSAAKAGVFCFASVFAAGFVLGTVPVRGSGAGARYRRMAGQPPRASCDSHHFLNRLWLVVSVFGARSHAVRGADRRLLCSAPNPIGGSRGSFALRFFRPGACVRLDQSSFEHRCLIPVSPFHLPRPTVWPEPDRSGCGAVRSGRPPSCPSAQQRRSRR